MTNHWSNSQRVVIFSTETDTWMDLTHVQLCCDILTCTASIFVQSDTSR